jgi:hypothetical protein
MTDRSRWARHRTETGETPDVTVIHRPGVDPDQRLVRAAPRLGTLAECQPVKAGAQAFEIIGMRR